MTTHSVAENLIVIDEQRGENSRETYSDVEVEQPRENSS